MVTSHRSHSLTPTYCIYKISPFSSLRGLPPHQNRAALYPAAAAEPLWFQKRKSKP